MIKFACSEEEEDDDTAYEDMLAFVEENYRPLSGAPPFSEELLLQYGLFILDQGLPATQTHSWSTQERQMNECEQW